VTGVSPACVCVCDMYTYMCAYECMFMCICNVCRYVLYVCARVFLKFLFDYLI
jgi:hypothetical protein